MHSNWRNAANEFKKKKQKTKKTIYEDSNTATQRLLFATEEWPQWSHPGPKGKTIKRGIETQKRGAVCFSIPRGKVTWRAEPRPFITQGSDLNSVVATSTTSVFSSVNHIVFIPATNFHYESKTFQVQP